MKVRASIDRHVHTKLVKLLQEYVNVFTWSNQDIPDLDTNIIEHHLSRKPECLCVKQNLIRTRPDTALKIREEFMKRFNIGFVVISEYPQWVANIVPVPKKDGKVRMCVDYKDLNKVIPKDGFPLPHIDVLVDNTS